MAAGFDFTAGSEAARVAIGCVLVASGVLKLGRTDPADVAALGVPAPAATVAAAALPVVEVVLAGCVLLVGGPWPAALAAVLFALFTAVVLRAAVRGAAVPCRCFGSLSSRPVSWLTVVRNVFFLVLAVVALVGGGTGAPLSWPVLGVLLGVSLALILVA